MDQRERNALDRHITGNYGEDQLREESGMCIWDDCGNDAIYCEGHAREYMQPDIDAMKALNQELVRALTEFVERGEAAGDIDGLPEYEQAQAVLAKVAAKQS